MGLVWLSPGSLGTSLSSILVLGLTLQTVELQEVTVIKERVPVTFHVTNGFLRFFQVKLLSSTLASRIPAEEMRGREGMGNVLQILGAVVEEEA